MEFQGDVGRADGVDDGTTEGGPSFRFKFGADEFEGSVADVGLFGFGVGVVGQWVGELVEEMDCGRASLGQRAISTAAEMVRDAALSDDSQPTSKGVPWAIVAELRQLLGDREKDVLNDVVGIVSREGRLAAPVINQRAVKMNDSLPSIGVVAASTLQQAGRSGKRSRRGGRLASGSFQF